MASSAQLNVRSTVVSEGKTIPLSAVYSALGGQNISPDLAWDAPPAGTKSLAVTLHDPDAPTTVGFTHWVLFNLSPDLRGLPAGAGAPGKAPKGAVLGFTDYGDSAYGGMAPPAGARWAARLGPKHNLRQVPLHDPRSRARPEHADRAFRTEGLTLAPKRAQGCLEPKSRA